VIHRIVNGYGYPNRQHGLGEYREKHADSILVVGEEPGSAT
jgi:hypothetical protein